MRIQRALSARFISRENIRMVATEEPSRTVVRLSLEVTPEVNELLISLANQSATSKSDLLRRAISLMEVAINAKRKGQRLAILHGTKDKIESLIVGVV
jgi:hypothetical protein